MNTVFLLTGGNLGNRFFNLKQAKKLLQKTCGSIVKESSIYKTAAWGFTEQPDFYNQALQLQTNFLPEPLMQALLSVEKNMGRERAIKMGPRIIDIDILLMDDCVINTAIVKIPHPLLHERRFALTPLAEIAPDIIHPVFNKSIKQLLAECKDNLPVYKISKEN